MGCRRDIDMWLVSAGFETWLLGIMGCCPIHLAEKGLLFYPWWSRIITCVWLAGVILRENECLVVGKISRASFTARRHVIRAGPAK